jgi:hypothetical protein
MTSFQRTSLVFCLSSQLIHKSKACRVQRGQAHPVAKYGSWTVSLTSAETDEWDVTEAVRLLSRFPQGAGAWKLLSTGAKVCLNFGLHLETTNQGFSLPADILQFAADRDIDIDFDIYTERMATNHGE